MMKLRKIQDIGDGIVSSVKFFEIDKEVHSMKFRDAAVVDRENLQRGNFFTKHSEKLSTLVYFCNKNAKINKI